MPADWVCGMTADPLTNVPDYAGYDARIFDWDRTLVDSLPCGTRRILDGDPFIDVIER